MNLKLLTSSIAAAALVAVPVAASANPASGLSVAKSASARAGSPTGRDSALSAPGSVVGLVLAALVVAGGIYLVVDDDDNEPDSP